MTWSKCLIHHYTQIYMISTKYGRAKNRQLHANEWDPQMVPTSRGSRVDADLEFKPPAGTNRGAMLDEYNDMRSKTSSPCKSRKGERSESQTTGGHTSFRSISYATYKLKERLSYLQFIGLIAVKTARRSPQIVEDRTNQPTDSG